MSLKPRKPLPKPQQKGVQVDISKADNDLRQVNYKVTPYMKEVNPGTGDALLFEKKMKNFETFWSFPDYFNIFLRFFDTRSHQKRARFFQRVKIRNYMDF